MRLTLALVLALLALAAPARAAGPQVGIADDRILLAGGPTADKAIAEWQRLGVQQVRIYALWNRIAPSRKAGDYSWSALDHAVALVTSAGMKPLLTITGPGPVWTSRHPRRRDPRYDPNPKLYAQFARMVAERYGDRVDRYVLWNEPNLSGWLRPQAKCKRGRCSTVGPHLYRALARAAYAAIHGADPHAQVLIGAMSSRGSDLRRPTSNQRPLAFLRGLACVDARYHRLRSGRCKHFKPLKADGFAFHPHGILTPPWQAFGNPDDVGIASLSRLTGALDRLQRMHRLKVTTRRFNLYIDEFGYQTRPPDVFAGVSLKRQDNWLQYAAYQAWRNPRVKLFSQYLWRDEPNSRSNSVFGGWQSGLRFAGGRAKPSLKHFATPFVVDAARRRLWGQVRRRDARTVEVQRRARGSKRWRTIARRRTDGEGYWSWRTRLVPGASYRYHAAGATSATVKRR